MIDHKHLIAKGKYKDKLNGNVIRLLIIGITKKLDMKFLDMVTNPAIGYEKGEHSGYTGVGIITTSHIVLHTWEKTKDFQLDVYSCKDFHPDQVIEYFDKHKFSIEDMKFFDRNYKIIEL